MKPCVVHKKSTHCTHFQIVPQLLLELLCHYYVKTLAHMPRGPSSASRSHQGVDFLGGFGRLSLDLPRLLNANHLLCPLAYGAGKELDLGLRVGAMNHDPNPALALWNRGVVNGDGRNSRQLQMEYEPPVIPLPCPEGYNVRLELASFPIVDQRDRQNPHLAGFFPHRVRRDGFEKVLHEMLDAVL